MNNKYELTDVSIDFMGTKLFQIKAKRSFGDVTKGELGGYIEGEKNLDSSGNAWISGNAKVYGNAKLEAKNNYTKGRFIGGDDSEKITIITDKTGSNYWKCQYVLGDFEITPQEEEKKIEKQKITLELTPEQIEKVKELLK